MMVTKVDSGVIVHDGGTIKDALDKVKPIADYVALRAYAGSASQIRITGVGIAGFFYLDGVTSTTTEDNGGTVICAPAVGAKRWNRIFDGPVNVLWFGADHTGSQDSSASIQNALNTGKSVHICSGNYRITTQLNVTTKGQKITGDGWGSVTGGATTRIFSSSDITFFRVTADYVQFNSIFFESTASSLDKPHIHFVGDSFPSVDHCRFTAVANTASIGGGITLDDGSGGIGGSVGVINNINISHGSIIVRRSDVHIKNCWVWANSRPYAIYASGSVGNLVIEGTDVLPPQTNVNARKAAIYLSGSLSNPRILGCNFDGNSLLSTGTGLLAENGVMGLLVSGCYGFGHNEDCIVLDSIISPHVIGNVFKNNNLSGNGATDITLRNTFAQLLEKPLINGNSFTQTSAVVGVAGPAVKLVATTRRAGVRITNNTIHQPGLGGGYTDIEILLEDGAFTTEIEGSLLGNIGQRTRYTASGTTSCVNTDTFKTIGYGVIMAYPPRPDQITLQYSATGSPPTTRFNSSNMPEISSMGVGLHGTFSTGTLHWQVKL